MRLNAILRGWGWVEGNVAPALQAAREQLQRSQLEVRVMVLEESIECSKQRSILQEQAGSETSTEAQARGARKEWHSEA